MLKLTNEHFCVIENSGFHTYVLQNTWLSMTTLKDVYGKSALKQHAGEFIKQ